MNSAEELKQILLEHEERLVNRLMTVLLPAKNLSRTQAAQFLGYNYDMMKQIPNTRLPCHKVGGKWVYQYQDLVNYKLQNELLRVM